jgi:hypothetical protein
MAVEADAVARALELIDDDRLVAGARVLRAANISPSASASSSSSSDANLKLAASLRKASRVVDVVRSLKATPDERSGWLVQGEHMGKRDVSIYYRLDPETKTKLTARVESPIDESLLVPMIRRVRIYTGPHTTAFAW